MMTSSCVPGFDELVRWSGRACALWSRCTPDEKQQWVQNYLQAHGRMANQSYIAALIGQMDARCAVSPAGSLYDGLNEGFDAGSESDSNQPSDAVQVLTSANFGRALTSVFHDLASFGSTAINSANKTNTYAPNNPVGGFGGFGGFPEGGTGISGGFNSPYGYGAGAISWTPIIIGGVIVVGLGVLLVTMSNRGR